MFFKIDVLKNVVIVTGKHLCKSCLSLIKFLDNFINKRQQHRRFPANIAKFFGTAFFYGTPLVAASENTLSKKTEALTKSMNMDILVIGTLNQVFIRGSYTQIILKFVTQLSSL